MSVYQEVTLSHCWISRVLSQPLSIRDVFSKRLNNAWACTAIFGKSWWVYTRTAIVLLRYTKGCVMCISSASFGDLKDLQFCLLEIGSPPQLSPQWHTTSLSSSFTRSQHIFTVTHLSLNYRSTQHQYKFRVWNDPSCCKRPWLESRPGPTGQIC